MTLVLASASRSRAAILEAAGIAFIKDPADLDEIAFKRGAKRLGAQRLALGLAEAKALAVSARRRGDLVIGADQTLALGKRLFDKPRDAAEAMAHLRALRNRTHTLHSAVALARNERVLWRHVGRARLTLRPFTEGFLRRYVGDIGGAALTSVGAYYIEERGIQLMRKIEGDSWTIRGLPLLPLLAELRRLGAVAR
ncbi:MAG: septum formation inhibitor Maf [Alphaproteobacteria bacterium]|nr:septum formation inhibitor Maf [Alphaproteobacteria bacterium]